jgi:propionyl-CoA carboxylase alpha chain
VVVVRDNHYQVAIGPGEDGDMVDFDGSVLRVQSDWRPGEPLFRGAVGGAEICVQIDRKGVAYRLFHAGAETDVQVLSPRAAELVARMPVKAPPDTSRLLLSPMPGFLSSVAVEEGQRVKAGEALAVVEAMKMENVLRAERDGAVARLHAAPGDSLAVDQIILEFE